MKEGIENFERNALFVMSFNYPKIQEIEVFKENTTKIYKVSKVEEKEPGIFHYEIVIENKETQI